MTFILSLLSNWRVLLAVGGIVAIIGAFGIGYIKGHGAASDKCEAAAMKAEIESLRQTIEINKRVQEAAVMRAEEREKAVTELEQKVADYEDHLEAAGGCVLSDADAERLSDIQ